MPDGIVQWFDAGIGEGAVIRGGRVFIVAASDVAPEARRPGAHVHFDVRDEHGAQRATNVTLRRGARGGRHHHRVGSLAGARRPDAKGAVGTTTVERRSSLSRMSHPLEVAHEWASRLRAGDVAAAVSLYASDATVHTPDQTLSGRPHLLAFLERSGLLDAAATPETHGRDGLAVVVWHRADPSPRSFEVRCRIEHGLIVEQWFGPPPEQMPTVEEAYEPPRTVVVQGEVGADVVDYARERLGHVIDRIGEPVWFVRTKLALAPDPARARRALAQVTLDVDGDLVRAHVAASDLHEAIDLLQRRLRDQLQHRTQRQRALHRSRGVPDAGAWRHGDVPGPRPGYFDRPDEERELVRHKSFSIDEMTPDEAAFDMDQLDFEFYLFRDLGSGEDALMRRDADGILRLTRLHPADADPGPTTLPIAVDEWTPPMLTVDEAIDTLNAGNQPLVFFANSTTGRGNVVYRRYDGHYGLLAPDTSQS